MFKWLRDKLMKGDKETFVTGLERNTPEEEGQC
jgi:hypothetical protein